MQVFRRKPETVTAIQVCDDNLGELLTLHKQGVICLHLQEEGNAITNRVAWVIIENQEHVLRVNVGDWLVWQGGQYWYPWPDDHLKYYYEPVPSEPTVSITVLPKEDRHGQA